MTRTRERFRRHSMFINAERKRDQEKRSAKRDLEAVEERVLQGQMERNRSTETGLLPVRLYAPEKFSLINSSHRRSVLMFLETLQRLVLEDKRKVYIDFSTTKNMFADGTLLFYAIVNRMARVTQPNKLISCTYPRNKIVAQVLSHLGFFRLFGQKYRVSIAHESVKYWRVADDTKVEGAKTKFLEALYKGTIVSESLSKKLYGALTEAMTNCKQHAYPDEDLSWILPDIAPDKRWWMFSQVRDGSLSVSFCDLGIGIPNTMRSGKLWSKTLLMLLCRAVGLDYNSDKAMILSALKEGGSRTGEDHRGKGLLEIRNVLEEHGQGQMNIYSGYAGYRYHPIGNIEQSADYDEEVPGTLIFWNIPIGNKLETSDE